MNSTKQLYYIHDPMCSWCWGFSKTWGKVKKELNSDIEIIYVLGGLAPDNNEIMDERMREYVQMNWKKIEKRIPGTRFNYNFWQECQPRRSTYPACRAVLATNNQDKNLELNMINKIQQGYYLQAKNPSEDDVLVGFANELGLDIKRFGIDLNSEETNKRLMQNIELAGSLNIYGFPSLILHANNTSKHIVIDYNDDISILNQINA
ncbi:MAG: DsbA family protein [Gammaproteobacteria bacterium]|nr:DsbA family protein [Gammaproteobacteria bacterium]